VIILANDVADEIASEPNEAESNGAESSSAEDGASPKADADRQEPEAPPDPLEEAKAEGLRLRDQLVRVAADFDNFRKRSRREISDAEKRAQENLLRELLPVFDNLERAAAVAETATDVKALADGIGLVMKQFHDTLAKLGIERIVAIGQPFDPAVHEAVQQIETPEHQPGTVMAEVQAGYRANERLIRPALVVVAKAAPN
jgi:molecular chaperone GrpE